MIRKCRGWTLVFVLAWTSLVAKAATPTADELLAEADESQAREINESEVKAKKRVKPKYPEAAKQMGLEGSCQVRFFIDEKGKPYEIKIEWCPKVFHDETKKAAWGWRFSPMMENGKAVKAQFILSLNYKLKKGGSVGAPPDNSQLRLEALAKYKKACEERGVAERCLWLGAHYYAGDAPVLKNLKMSAKYFRLSCDANSAEGCFNYAVFYYNGEVFDEDPAKAKEIFQKACDLGSLKACKWAHKP